MLLNLIISTKIYDFATKIFLLNLAIFPTRLVSFNQTPLKPYNSITFNTLLFEKSYVFITFACEVTLLDVYSKLSIAIMLILAENKNITDFLW